MCRPDPMPLIKQIVETQAARLVRERGTDVVGLAALLQLTQLCFLRHGKHLNGPRLTELLALQRACVAARAAELQIEMSEVDAAAAALRQMGVSRVSSETADTER